MISEVAIKQPAASTHHLAKLSREGPFTVVLYIFILGDYFVKEVGNAASAAQASLRAVGENTGGTSTRSRWIKEASRGTVAKISGGSANLKTLKPGTWVTWTVSYRRN